MSSKIKNVSREGEPVEGEFENSPLGKFLAARAAEGIRKARGV